MQPIDDAAFAPRAAPPPLAEDEIHVWRLSAGEGVAPRAIGAAARQALERLLGDYAGRPGAPAIERGAHGKPFAPELPELDFNLTHAGSEILLAFARRQPLGIDLEHTARHFSIEGIARRFFAAAEADALERLPADARGTAFLRLWTHKEAVLKALGEGLSFGLERVQFAFGGDGQPELKAIADEAGPVAEWRLLRLDPAPSLFGALAWRGAPRRLRTFTLAPGEAATMTDAGPSLQATWPTDNPNA